MGRILYPETDQSNSIHSVLSRLNLCENAAPNNLEEEKEREEKRKDSVVGLGQSAFSTSEHANELVKLTNRAVT